MMTLTFLGTSSGVPTKNRNVSALALQVAHSREWWMIDCGEATQHRLQHVPLSVHDLAGICITTCTATTVTACQGCWPVPP